MDGSILITGGTRGLGFATVRALLRADAGRHLILPVRNLAAGREVFARLGSASRDASGEVGADLGNLHLVECDLGDLASIRRAVDEIGKLLDDPGVPPLRAMAANAGVQRWRVPTQTADGFESTFGINLLGHYLLIRLLTEEAAEHAARQLMGQGRIILVSSSTHWGDVRHTWGIVAPPRWNSVEALARPEVLAAPGVPAAATASSRKDATSAYSTSKLALIYLTHELARRLSPEFEVYSYNPGLIPGTGLVRDAPAVAQFLGRTVFQSVRLLPGAVGARRSGAELARALVGPSPAQSGDYLDRGRLADSSPESYDSARELELWDVAAKLVGITR